jgi:hypothetical protein
MEYLTALAKHGNHEKFFSTDLIDGVPTAATLANCSEQPVGEVQKAIKTIKDTPVDDLPFILMLLSKHPKGGEILELAVAMCEKRSKESKGDEKVKEYQETFEKKIKGEHDVNILKGEVKDLRKHMKDFKAKKTTTESQVTAAGLISCLFAIVIYQGLNQPILPQVVSRCCYI